jgi:error-prone DNA polymerase
VFQIESRAQMSMLPRLRPNRFYDLVIEVAIVRPGPIQGDMVHPYLRRRAGEEEVDYPDEAVRAVLEKTLGVPIFQEQAMRLAVVAAGFTPGEADQLRRAMGAWRRPGIIDGFRKKLIDGMRARGYSAEFAERVFNQIRGFGEYGFPESHAASFALLVYVSAWLKRYYPDAFVAALLNSQPMGFYAPAQLVSDARKHGVEVRPCDANFSHWDCTLEKVTQSARENGSQVGARGGALRLGFRMVSGLAQPHAEHIVRCRGAAGFETFEDFCRRTRLRSSVMLRLARADVFSSLKLPRRTAQWLSLPPQTTPPLFAETETSEPEPKLDAMSAFEQVVADYGSVGLSLRDHPVRFLRPLLENRSVVPASELAKLPTGRWVTVAGLVLLRQRPSTAKGITFVTLEDETGVANLIVRPAVWERYHRAAKSATVMLTHGRLQNEAGVIHVLVAKLEDLSRMLSTIEARSRDFR